MERWQQRILDGLEVRAAEANSRSYGTSATNRISRVGFSTAAHPYLVRAAQGRTISLSGYIRRATLAMVARDLGMDPKVLFELDAAIAPIDRRGAPPTKDLDGELYGTWGWESRQDEPSED